MSGIILSGSPYSVYDKDSPHADPDIFLLGIPILGICYGLQVPARFFVMNGIIVQRDFYMDRKWRGT